MTNSAAQLISKFENTQVKKGIPVFKVGDGLRVHVKIVEGEKSRVQIFEGIVIRRAHGNLPTATFTVRKISFNIGVEKTFLLNSPNIDKIELVNRGEVRRARLFYLRDRFGKAARVKKTTSEAQIKLENAAIEAQLATNSPSEQPETAA